MWFFFVVVFCKLKVSNYEPLLLRFHKHFYVVALVLQFEFDNNGPQGFNSRQFSVHVGFGDKIRPQVSFTQFQNNFVHRLHV